MRQNLLLLLFFLPSLVYAQNDIAIGEWKSHLNYSESFKSVETKNYLYCATRYGLFYYSYRDRSVNTMSKVQGLSGVEIDQIGYDDKNDLVFLAYSNGNIDIISDQSITNAPFLVNATNIIGRKTVNNFYFYEDKAYISTSFGIVVFDVLNNLVIDSYLNLDPTGNKLEIFDVAIINRHIYAATPVGIRSADMSENLPDFGKWVTTLKGSFSIIEIFNDELFVYADSNSVFKQTENGFELFRDEVELRHMEVQHGELIFVKQIGVDSYNSDLKIKELRDGHQAHALIDRNNALWVSAPPYGIIRYNPDETINYIMPNGPKTRNCWTAAYANGEIWVASGGLDLAYNAVGSNSGVYQYANGKWTNFNSSNVDVLSPLRDMHLVKIDPERMKKYVASYNNGLAEFDSDNNVKVWDKFNTGDALSSLSSDPKRQDIRIAGLDIDEAGNVWMTQQFATNQLVLKTAEDEWYSFNIGNDKRVNDVLVDGQNNKWVVVHLDGIYVYNHGESLTDANDDIVVKLTASQGNGDLPANEVYALAKDKEGNVWVGTADGVTVFYSPENIFSGQNYDGSRPLIGEDADLSWLLEGQKINAIAVDGADQKWIATENGVFVTNPNGSEILHNFNISNSPLLSDNVRDIEVNGETGEVFMLTDQGIISYRANATEGKEVHSNVLVYPNPVRPGYSGQIAIKGLVSNANVKITDIAGNLVYETTAEGGQAVWDGRTFEGREVSSGVYLVFSSNMSGKETFISKVMIIR